MNTPIHGQAGRIARFAVWLLATVGVAYAVAWQSSTPEVRDDRALSAPALAASARQTTALAEHTIQPVVSGDGTVVARNGSFVIEAGVSPEALAYQLLKAPVSVKARITGGPAGFDCPWLGLDQGPDGRVIMRCQIPADVTVVAGLSGAMVLAMSPPTDATALPVTAVVGNAGEGQVVVVAPDGTTAVRRVALGISDTFWIEITDGLSPSDQVLAAPIQADFRVVTR